MRIPISGQTYTARSTNAAAEKAINMFVETTPSGKSQAVMYQKSGLVSETDVGIGPGRGTGFHNGNLVLVSNNEVYTRDTAGVNTLIGTLDTTLGPVSIANFDLKADQETVIADGTALYHWDGTTFSKPTLPAGVLPETVVLVDGYFIINDTSNPGRFWVSGSYDGETWGANSYATAERDGDKLKQVVVNHRDVYHIGEYTTEPWHNPGSTVGITFRPRLGQLIEKGTIAPWSIAKHDRYVVMLAQDQRGAGQVIAIQGNQHQVISTRALEVEIASYSDITDAVAYTYYEQGHSFYELSFPTANKTWCYDFVEQAWHERASTSLGSTPGIYGRHRAVFGKWFDNKNIVQDAKTGKVYRYDVGTYTDNTDSIPRVRTTQYIHNDNNDTLFHRKLELEVEAGVGDNTVTDPQVAMRYSDDGGHSWSNEIWRSLGKKGEYGHSVVWRNLGKSSSRLYEFKCTDNVKFVIISGYIDVQVSEQL